MKRRPFIEGSTSPAKGVATQGRNDTWQNDTGVRDELSCEDGKHAEATAGWAQYNALDRHRYSQWRNQTSRCSRASLALVCISDNTRRLCGASDTWSCQRQHFALTMQTSLREKQGCARRRAQPWCFRHRHSRCEPSRQAKQSSTHSPSQQHTRAGIKRCNEAEWLWVQDEIAAHRFQGCRWM